MGVFDFLLNAIPNGAPPLPPVPPDAIDPWTGEDINPTDTTTPPELPAPIELSVDIPAAQPAAAETDVATIDATPAAPATAAPIAATVPTVAGTPITREEVMQLLSEVEATIYLMV